MGVDRSERPMVFFASWGVRDMDPAVAATAFRHHTARAPGEPSTKLAMLGELASKLLVTAELMARFPDYSAAVIETLTSALLSKQRLQQLGMRDFIVPCISTNMPILKYPKRHGIISDTVLSALGAVYQAKGAAVTRSVLLRSVLHDIDTHDPRTTVLMFRPLHVLASIAGSPNSNPLIARVTAKTEGQVTVGIFQGDKLLGEGTGTTAAQARDKCAQTILREKYAGELERFPVDSAAVPPSVEMNAICFERADHGDGTQ